MSTQPALSKFIDEQVDTYVNSYHVLVKSGITALTVAICVAILIMAKVPIFVGSTHTPDAPYLISEQIHWPRVLVVSVLFWCLCYKTEYCYVITKNVYNMLFT